jgi:hypothetical protein
MSATADPNLNSGRSANLTTPLAVEGVHGQLKLYGDSRVTEQPIVARRDLSDLQPSVFPPKVEQRVAAWFEFCTYDLTNEQKVVSAVIDCMPFTFE